MLALIDLDILPYSYGGLTFEDGVLMPDNLLRKKVDDKIKSITKRSGADSWVGYLTDSAANFRLDVATILPYKGNRSGNKKPPRYQMLRDYLMDTYPDQVTMVVGIEADDQLAIDQYEELEKCWKDESHVETIICTPDKDLLMTPGWHYNWQTDTLKLVTELEGLRFFYKQLLTGDMVDNIRGLYGVGEKSSLLTKLDSMDTEQDMFLHVQEEYRKRFGSYADQFLLETGRLLWMLRTRDDEWEFPLISKEQEEVEDASPF